MDIKLFGLPLVILMPVIAIAVYGLFIGVRGAVVAGGVCAWLFLAVLAIHHL